MKTAFAEFLVQRNQISSEVAERLSEWCRRTRVPIGLIAVGHGLISGAHIDDVLEHQRESCVRFGEAAIEMGLLTQHQVDALLDIQRFREAAEITEGLALSGQLSFSKASEALGAFLQQDPLNALEPCTELENG